VSGFRGDSEPELTEKTEMKFKLNFDCSVSSCGKVRSEEEVTRGELAKIRNPTTLCDRWCQVWAVVQFE
jgi:hypothetical protein